MMYEMRQIGCNFYIQKKNIFPAYNALLNYAKEASRRRILRSDDFCDAMSRLGWVISLNRDGDIDEISFVGEYLENENEVFDALAPFVENGSYIDMVGDDDAMWYWGFNNGNVNVYPIIIRHDELTTEIQRTAQYGGD